MSPDVLRYAGPLDLAAVTLPGGARLPLPPPDADDAEHTLAAVVGGRAVTAVVRRVGCALHDGLLRRDDPAGGLPPQAAAALRWRAFRRYAEVVALKRLTGGLSGSQVVVVRPRLRAPAFDPTDPEMASAGPADALAGAWGSPLLVKTGPAAAIRQEFARAAAFLRDRRSPFVAPPDELLDVRPPDAGADHATTVSGFLGGDVIQAEPLDRLVRGSPSADRPLQALDALAARLATWHGHTTERPLGDWSRAFRPAVGDPDPWRLFGWYNLRAGDRSDPAGRAAFAAGVGWDIPFGSSRHLEGHLLGKPGGRDGLAYRLAELPAAFSLVHGDLNPRNVLCDGEQVWLIDFQHAGAGPVLADLARLEVNLRLWCVDLGPAADGSAEAARALEGLLLDHLHGSECSLEPVRRLAPALGAAPDDLEKIARCVVHLRRLAGRWCVPRFCDGRDYLAALYLAVLSLVPHFGRGNAGAANERWVMALCWVLEEALDHVFGREPFRRGVRAYDPVYHVNADLARGPGTWRRARDLCDTVDGRAALAPVAALRGVLQGEFHHLDAFYHTLTTVAYLEAILADPVAALLDPGALDRRVAADLAAGGLAPAPPDPAQADPPPPAVPWLAAHRAQLDAHLAGLLTDEVRLALVWCAMLHDVGKPATRTVADRPSGPGIQFLGHERYGVEVVRGRLAAWFPDPAAADRVADYIRHHHHSHQLLGDGLLRRDKEEPPPADRLFELLAGAHRPDVLAWVGKRTDPARDEYRPHLGPMLLHGYADRLAARGRRAGATVTEWAAATLGVLAVLASWDELGAAAARHGAAADGTERVLRDFAHELTDGPGFGRVMAAARRRLAGYAGPADGALNHLRGEADAIRAEAGIDPRGVQ